MVKKFVVCLITAAASAALFTAAPGVDFLGTPAYSSENGRYTFMVWYDKTYGQDAFKTNGVAVEEEYNYLVGDYYFSGLVDPHPEWHSFVAEHIPSVTGEFNYVDSVSHEQYVWEYNHPDGTPYPGDSAGTSGSTTSGSTASAGSSSSASSGSTEKQHEHKWDSGKVTTKPTCTKEGVKTFTCKECGKTKTEPIPKIDHTWDEGKVTKEATCTGEGEKTLTCTVCGTTKTEKIPKTDHTWDNGTVTKEATCKDEGEKTVTCTVCGETKTEKIPKTEDHKWDEGKVTTEAACTEDGVMTYTCTVCGKTRTETIPAAGHTPGDWEVTKQPTLLSAGEKVQKCTVCGEVLANEEIPAKTGELIGILCAAGAAVIAVIAAVIVKKKKK